MKFDNKDRIALFGTSADPPTIGHKKIIEELSKIYTYTVAYASNNPKKNHKEDIDKEFEKKTNLFLKNITNNLEEFSYNKIIENL